uniref:G_PROTEIN_RECEP_F1_2 domain-containing protein n=1 Tax=Steinernema glaseri TaxID=37863 RepID=A0A1I7YZB8_9BILA
MSASDAIFDRALDVITITSVFCFAATFYIIIKHSPKYMASLSRPLLNIFAWNSLVNGLFLVARPLPMMPLTCFKLTGVLSMLVKSEDLGHLVVMMTFLATLNVAIGLVISFSFRYMAITGCRLLQARRIWLFLYAAVPHSVFSAGYLWSYSMWAISMDEYRGVIPQSLRENLFCFSSEAPRSFICTLYLFVVIALVVGALVILVGLSFYELHKNEKIISERTAKMQRKLLWNLIVLSGIPICLGGTPFMTFAVFFFQNEWPYGQVIGAICLVMMTLFGPVMCVACLLFFENYRKALIGIFLKKCTHVVTVTQVVSIAKLTSQPTR